MAYKSLAHFISVLESAGELIRIKEYISPYLEITEITDRIVKNNGKALLFENNGSEFPLLINAFASEKRMCLALGIQNLDDVGKELGKVLNEFLGPKGTFLEKLKMIPALREVASWMPRVMNGKGSCQEIMMKEPDLTETSCSDLLAGRWWTFYYVACCSYEGSGIRHQKCRDVPDAGIRS